MRRNRVRKRDGLATLRKGVGNEEEKKLLFGRICGWREGF